MKKTIIIVSILVVTAILIGLAGTVNSDSGESQTSERSLFTARIQDLDIAVTENGNLKAKNSANIVPQFDREGTIMTLVEEGKEVIEGEVLIVFDKTDIETQIDDLQTRLIQYETELDAAKADLQIQIKDNASTTRKADLALDMSKLELNKYLEGDAPNAYRKAMLAVERAQSEFDRAKEKMAQVPELLAEGFLTQDQSKEEEFRHREAEINLENASTDLELLLKYTKPMDIKKKESDVDEKDRDLQRSKEKAKISIKEKEARVTRHERQVKSTKARLETLRKQAEKMTITAPKPGIVMYGDPARPWEQDQIKVGNRVWSGMTLLTIPDLTEMQCLVQIHEADINKIKENQEVLITVDSEKGESFTGFVSKVAKVATSQGWRSNSSSKSFPVEITMHQAEVELRAGITAKVQINIESLADVLVVPIHSVFNESGKQFCFVQTASEIENRPVTLGRHNEHFVVVEDGLQKGEKVLLFDPRRDGASSSPTGTEENIVEEEAPKSLSALTP